MCSLVCCLSTCQPTLLTHSLNVHPFTNPLSYPNLSTHTPNLSTHTQTFSGRPLVSAETSTIDLSAHTPAPASKTDSNDPTSTTSTSSDDKTDKTEADKGAEKDPQPSRPKLTTEEGTALCAWLKSALGDRVREVRVTNRLEGSPAIVTDHESGALRRMMKMVCVFTCLFGVCVYACVYIVFHPELHILIHHYPL